MFTGLVRDFAGKEEVKQLHLQAYSPMTEDGIFQAAQLASERWKLQSSLITHRIGNMKPSDVIVFVATASAHRRNAFEAADFLMDYLKTEASERAHVFLPTATVYETGGLYVNQEGRLQVVGKAYQGGLPIVQSGGGNHPHAVPAFGIAVPRPRSSSNTRGKSRSAKSPPMGR